MEGLAKNVAGKIQLAAAAVTLIFALHPVAVIHLLLVIALIILVINLILGRRGLYRRNWRIHNVWRNRQCQSRDRFVRA
jgi:hypothetical protein